MPHPSSYRPAPGTVPDSPGVYKFRDARGTVIYVGKAKSLRSRLGSYFQDLGALHARTRQMVTTAASVEWTVVGTEVEALQLEYSWIKQYDPRFNVRYRDDKSYPSLAVTLDEDYPRLQVMRGPKRRGVRYFGPYAHAWAIRETLDLLLRVFPARTCSKGVFVRAGQVGRPCLLGYIGKCSAPCVGRVTADEHRAIVEDFCDFMAGKTDLMVKRLEKEMAEAADAQEYERAARLRDDLGALRRAVEKQTVVLPGGTDADVVAVAEDELEAAVQVFHVRGGRVRGQRGFVVDKVEELDTAGLMAQFVEQVYGSAPDEALPGGFGAPEPRKGARTKAGGRVETTVVDDVPREVLVPVVPTGVESLTDWLSQRRGGPVTIRVPQRGDKRALAQTVERNAKQALMQHKLRRSTDLTARSRALAEIQEALGLVEAPLRIECFDVSHVQGSNTVASMVVFEDGLPRKSEYRRFAVRGTQVAEGNAQDDTASLAEVISRRFARHLAERLEDGENVADGEGGDGGDREGRSAGPIDPTTGRPRRFAYPPNLVVVDGGAPQVAAAARALAALGVDDVALCGLAKRLEEVWLPGDDDPVVLPRTSEGLYLLQRVRDEAHRFAIAYHRQKRSSAMTVSALDGIPGLGETRRKALLKHFGSVKRLRAATAEEVAEVPGVGRRTAEAVVAALRGEAPATPAFDPVTGEVVEEQPVQVAQ